MMKTSAVTLLLLLALLSLDATGGSPRSVEGDFREKMDEDSMKSNEMHVEDLERTLQELLQDTNGTEDGNETHVEGEEHEGEEHDDEDHADEFHDDVEHHDEEHHNPPWGAGILAAFLVNLCTLIGVFAFVPASIFGRKASIQKKEFLFHIMIPSFACGALLATTVFLLIPESLVLLSGGHEDHSDEHEEEHGDEHEDEHEDEHRFLEGEEEEESESDASWKFGVSVLAGYFIPFIFSGFFPHSHIPEGAQDRPDERESALSGKIVANDEVDESEEDDGNLVSKDVESSEESKTTDVDKEEQFVCETVMDYRLAASILAGDFFHNFADGVFIGSAFLLCDRNLAIIVTATTVFHELSQELADYFLLTNQCHFPAWKALAFNFASGFSVLLGVIVIFSTDVSNTAIGVILAMSAGVYFYVALTECAPRVNSYLTSTSRRACSFLFWILGAVPIGLVLLNHSHCEE